MSGTVNTKIEKNLGPVTAYGYAVANGYTGTEEQFGNEMASVKSSANAAAASAAEAAQYTSSAVGTWLAANMSNPDSPPLDRSLSQQLAAAPADMVGNLKSALNAIPANTKITPFGMFAAAHDISADQEAYPTISLTPRQNGDGEPSGSNVRPIVPYNGLRLFSAKGKNLFDKTNFPTISGYFNGSNQFVYPSTGHVITYIPCKPNTTYTVSRVRVNQSTTWRFNAAYSYTIPVDSTPLHDIVYSNSAPGTSAGNRCTFTIETDEFAKYLVIYLCWTNMESQANSANTLIIAEGNISDYEAYNGESKSVSWSEDIVGGRFIGKGHLESDWALIDSYAGEEIPGEWISDRDAYVAGTTPTTGAQVAYKLAAPIITDITPTSIAFDNGVKAFSDSGEISIEYLANGAYVNTVKNYGAIGDGIADDTDAFEAALRDNGYIYIPKGSYKLTKNIFANGELAVEQHEAASYTGITPAYAHDPIVDNVSMFGRVAQVAPVENIAGIYGESFCYNSKTGKYIVGYYAPNAETDKTVLAVVDPGTFAIDAVYTYALTALQTLAYNPATNQIYLCSEDYDGIYVIDADSLNSAPTALARKDDAKILMYDSGLNALVSIKYTQNIVRVNVFDSDYSALLYTKNIDVTGFDRTGINGSEAFGGHIFQTAWNAFAEIDIISGNVTINKISSYNEIEDLCYHDGLMMMTHYKFNSTDDNPTEMVYKYDLTGNPAENKRYEQTPNETYHDVDLNTIVKAGVSSVSVTVAGSHHFPSVECSQGILVTLLQSDANDTLQVAVQYFIQTDLYRDTFRRQLYRFDEGLEWSDWVRQNPPYHVQNYVNTDANGNASLRISSNVYTLIGVTCLNFSGIIALPFVDRENSVFMVQLRDATDFSVKSNLQYALMDIYYSH